MPDVSIHVRRGDYIGNTDYGGKAFHIDLTETGYYEKAIAAFPDDSFLVFSDETEWCKQKWGEDARFHIVEGQSEIEDLNMMASCKANIIANSSYSWWAAWLNPNQIGRAHV